MLDLINGPIIGASHRKRMEALLRHFHALGMSLCECGDRRRLCRSPSTLKRYTRRAGLAFPDYIPMALRPKKNGAGD